MNTQAAANILELLPNLVLLPGGKHKSAEKPCKHKKAPARPRPAIRQSVLCNELISLAKVASHDVLEVLIQVQPSTWGFNLWVNDPDANSNDSDDSYSGMRKATPYRMAICHAAPDLLRWLQENGHTGGIALEFSRMDGGGETLKLFLYIPEPMPAAEPVPDEYACVQVLQRLANMMEESVAQHTKLMREIVKEHFQQQRRMAVQCIHQLEQMNKMHNSDNDKYRDLGVSMFETSLEQTKKELLARMSGGFEQVKKTIEDGRHAQEELAALMPAPDTNRENDEFVRDILKTIVTSLGISSKNDHGKVNKDATPGNEASSPDNNVEE